MPPVYSESEASPKGRAMTGGSQTQSVDVKEIRIDSEDLKNREGRDVKVSSIEITLKKK